MSQTKAQLLDNIKDNVQLDARNSLRFADTDSSHYVAFKAPATVSSNVTWTLPAADGSANYVLATDGSGTLSWIADPAGQWTTSGSNIYFTGGNVGIGDSSPSNPLSVTGASAFNGDLTLTGSSYNVVWDKSDNALEFADNAKAVFGTGDDLQIWHDGTHSYLDNDTGWMHLFSDNFAIKDKSGGDAMIYCLHDGEVQLFYDNGEKLNTVTDGVNITGSLQFADDTNTYLAHPSSDVLAVTAGGNEVISMLSGGNVRINGTPAWTETGGDYGNLSIRGTTASSSGFLNLGNGAAATNSEFDLARIKIHNGATEVARITGITGDGNNDSGEIWFATQASGGSLTTALVIDKDQKVGIGTTSPTGIHSLAKVLEISGGDGGDLIIGNNASSNIGAGAHIGAIAFKNIDSSTGSVPHYAGIRCEAADTSGNMDLRFYTGIANLEADTPQVYINSTGLVGISTTTVSSPLHVKGIDTTIGVHTYPQLTLETEATDGAADKGSGIMFLNHDGNGGKFGGGIRVLNENATVSNHASYMAFTTRPAGGSVAERVRIDSEGHLGLGTTTNAIPSADWGATTSINKFLKIKAEDYACLTLEGPGAGSTLNTITQGVGDNIHYMSYNEVDNQHNLKVHIASRDVEIPGGDIWFGTAGKGICLGVTSNTDSNTLDDYEEGSFTPVLRAHNSSTGQVNGSGTYVRVGKIVHVQIGFNNCDCTNIPNSATIKVDDLPFVVDSPNIYNTSSTLMTHNVDTELNGLFYTNDNTDYLLGIYAQDAGPWVGWPSDNFNQGSLYLHFNMSFRVD